MVNKELSTLTNCYLERIRNLSSLRGQITVYPILTSSLDWKNLKCSGGRISKREEDSSTNDLFDCESGIYGHNLDLYYETYALVYTHAYIYILYVYMYIYKYIQLTSDIWFSDPLEIDVQYIALLHISQ